MQDKSTYATAEVVKSFVNETETAKEKTLLLVPGANVKAVLGDGDDIIQTHVGSGLLKKLNKHEFKVALILSLY